MRSLRKRVYPAVSTTAHTSGRASSSFRPFTRAAPFGRLIANYYDARNAGAWSSKAKVGNLKRLTSAVAYLEENGLHTLDDLEARLDSLHSSLDETKTTLDANKKRTKELHELLRYAETYKRFEPLHDQLSAIKWKYKRERFKSEHESELRQFYMARRKLPGGIRISDWQHELATLEHEGYAAYAKYKTLRDELVKLLDVKYCVDRALSAREDEGRKTRPLCADITSR